MGASGRPIHAPCPLVTGNIYAVAIVVALKEETTHTQQEHRDDYVERSICELGIAFSIYAFNIYSSTSDSTHGHGWTPYSLCRFSRKNSKYCKFGWLVSYICSLDGIGFTREFSLLPYHTNSRHLPFPRDSFLFNPPSK